REMRKIKRNLDGIRNMEKLPGCLVVIDTRREGNALQEARKLGIPTICLIDSDGNPELADIAIPGNDDSMRSIDVVVRELCLAITEGLQDRNSSSGGREATLGPSPVAPVRRSRRATFRPEESSPTAEPDDAGEHGGAAIPAFGAVR
ncbi:MAG: 30S ribosomal protein S2, partial [Planctomycetota bacterium]